MDGLYSKRFGFISNIRNIPNDNTRYIVNNCIRGLAGKFFNWTWVEGIFDPGIFPLNATNNSSNVTGTTGLPSAAHRYGVNLFNTSIAFGDALGDNYAFVAIGYFIPPTTGTYTFYTSSDDESAVWLGELAKAGYGRTIANAVVNNGMDIAGGQPNTERSGTIDLIAGIAYPIRIIFQEQGGGDNLTFSWAGPGISKTTDLSQHFYTPIKNGVLLGRFLDTDSFIEAEVQSGVFNTTQICSDKQPPNNSASSAQMFYDFLDPRCYPGSGSTIYDISGNGRNATIVGSPTFTYPYFTNFSDSNYIDVPNSGINSQGQTAITYSAMVMFDAQDANDTIFENGLYTSGLLLRHESGVQISVYAASVAVTQQPWRSNIGSWYFINLVRVGQVGYIYVNGEMAVAPFNFTQNITTAETAMWLMRSRHTTAQSTTGKLAHFSVYNAGLSSAAIKRNYKNLVTRYKNFYE
jgi:GLEYA domain/Concanavalin A-like lectin/glucanases superfamily